MRILYAIQGTGNGHLSRAREIIPHLLNYGTLDLLVSGTQAEVDVPYLIRYKKKGVGFTFGTRGGIDWVDSIKRLHPFQFVKDIFTFPVQDYDFILNDFEPVTAWAARLRCKPILALSHQSAFVSPLTPRPEKHDAFAERIFKYYAPATAHIAFHFQAYDSFIHTPVIRSEVRKLQPENKGHITVYLPAHGDEIIIRYLSQIPDMEWQVFSKHSKQSYRVGNVFIEPVNNSRFTESLANSNGLITAGGFESPAEALFLGKKVLVVPMFDQYEQLCNAEALKRTGGTVVSRIDEHVVPKLENWLQYGKAPKVHYPDHVASLLEPVFHAKRYTDWNSLSHYPTGEWTAG